VFLLEAFNTFLSSFNVFWATVVKYDRVLCKFLKYFLMEMSFKEIEF